MILNFVSLRKEFVMTVISFEIESSEADKVKAVLKALGVKKIKTRDDRTKMTKAEFEKKLKESKSGKGTLLHSKQEVSNFFNTL